MVKNSILLSLLVSSCSNLIYSSEEIHKDLNRNNIDLKKEQFYNQHKIAFEMGKNKSLRFSLKVNEKDQISANSQDDDFGCVVYDSTKYFIISKSSNTVILVNKQYIANYKKTSRIIESRSVE